MLVARVVEELRESVGVTTQSSFVTHSEFLWRVVSCGTTSVAFFLVSFNGCVVVTTI